MNKSYNIISWNSSWFKFYTFIMYHGRHIVRHCWVIWIMGMHCCWKGGSDQQDCCWCPGANRRRVINQHDDVIKWKHFPLYWPFVRGIHPYPVDSSHKIQWCRAFMFSLICAWTNGWVNNRDAGDSRRHRAHYDVTEMTCNNHHADFYKVSTMLHIHQPFLYDVSKTLAIF